MRIPNVRRALLALLFLVFGGVPLQGQSVPGPTEVDSLAWANVVQRNASPRTFTARIVSADSASIVFQHEGRFFFVPVSEVERMDISLGRPRIGVARGAGHGFVSAALLLGLLYAAGSGCEDCYFNPREIALDAAVPFTLVMTGVGALTGLLPGKERWIRVQLPVTVRPAPVR